MIQFQALVWRLADKVKGARCLTWREAGLKRPETTSTVAWLRSKALREAGLHGRAGPSRYQAAGLGGDFQRDQAAWFSGQAQAMDVENA